MTDKIQTLHTDPRKTNKRIDRDKYELVKTAILSALKNKTLDHTELQNAVESILDPKFEGSVAWYNETVKLDLEARGIVERIKEGKRLLFRLKTK